MTEGLEPKCSISQTMMTSIKIIPPTHRESVYFTPRTSTVLEIFSGERKRMISTVLNSQTHTNFPVCRRAEMISIFAGNFSK